MHPFLRDAVQADGSGTLPNLGSYKSPSISLGQFVAIEDVIVTTQVAREVDGPDAMELYYIAEEGINGCPSKASRMASKTFLACFRAVER